ncbi:MAG: hypothetical protein JWQ35_105, partial [Bacteriovoracaceae bacterium]|nr:hypothetical protein [Bacteriovoracaceae bacterium]
MGFGRVWVFAFFAVYLIISAVPIFSQSEDPPFDLQRLLSILDATDRESEDRRTEVVVELSKMVSLGSRPEALHLVLEALKLRPRS